MRDLMSSSYRSRILCHILPSSVSAASVSQVSLLVNLSALGRPRSP